MSVSAVAAATMVLDVRSTQVTIHVLPFFETGRGPIKSVAQLVKGCNGMAENDSVPIRSWFELFEAAQTLQKRTKCVTSASRPGQ